MLKNRVIHLDLFLVITIAVLRHELDLRGVFRQILLSFALDLIAPIEGILDPSE